MRSGRDVVSDGSESSELVAMPIHNVKCLIIEALR